MPYADPARKKASDRAYHVAHRADHLKQMRAWRERNPDYLSYFHTPEARARANALKRALYPEQREKIVARNVASQRRNPVAHMARCHAYWARKRNAPGRWTPAEWKSLVRKCEGRCAYCGQVKRLVPDHKTPLSRGGSNSIRNIAPSCVSCNSRKRALTAREFVSQIRPLSSSS